MFEYGKKTYIMGILNVTPDSFSDGGNFTNVDIAVKHAKDMVEEGADIIDLGGESTRPGHKFVSAEEELRRIVPVIKELKKVIKVPISVDTYKSEVAVNNHIILTIDTDTHPPVFGEDFNVHIQLIGENGTEYDKDIMVSIKEFLQKSIDKALEAGVKKDKIVLDPGIGFGKTFEQNVEVLRRLNELQDLGYPVLLGTSRKSVLGNIVAGEPKDRVEATVATTVTGIRDGVDIVRVHDVKENLQAAMVADKLYR